VKSKPTGRDGHYLEVHTKVKIVGGCGSFHNRKIEAEVLIGQKKSEHRTYLKGSGGERDLRELSKQK